MHFKDKTIIITGASDGIGAALAIALAREGAKLVLAARNVAALEKVAAQCAPAQVLVQRTDVGVQADCKALIEAAQAKFGGIDILVNNAGVSGHAMFDDVTDFTWYEDMMRVNFFGTLWCTHYALPALKASRGLMVGVSSLAGKVGVPGRTAYSPSKFAMVGFMDALRIELRGTGVDEVGAMSVDECVRQTLDAMQSRKRELIMTAKGKLGVWLKLVAPGLVDNMALKALKKSA
jgi:NAD(P)-dependent dehydrogenase (short-subunit alcohol dehydrogenase family)